MGLIAEFAVSTPLMLQTRKAVPEMEFGMEDLQLPRDGSTKYMFWTNGNDIDDLEQAMEEDPTMAEYCQLAEASKRRLYRVTFSERGLANLTYPAASKYDITFLEWTGMRRSCLGSPTRVSRQTSFRTTKREP
jgi:hypothetical protein